MPFKFVPFVGYCGEKNPSQYYQHSFDSIVRDKNVQEMLKFINENEDVPFKEFVDKFSDKFGKIEIVLRGNESGVDILELPDGVIYDATW